MADVKIGGQTYADIDRLEFVNADTNESVYFMESDILLGILQNADNTIVRSYYENQYLTVVGNNNFTDWATRLFGTIYLPNVTESKGGKMSCETAILPKLTATSNVLFYGTKLKVIDLSALTQITGTYDMAGNVLKTIILRGNTVPVFSNSNINNYKTGVTVYVPQNMISAYEANSVWASLVSTKQWTFTALEGSEYEDPNWFKQ